MNYKPIISGSPESSVLIFGCSGLMGRIGRKNSLKILKLALEHGINHFDTARSYGYGESEGCLSDILQGRRHQIVITSKFGILTSSRGKFLKLLKPLAQGILSTFPLTRGLIRGGIQKVGGGAVGGNFDIRTASQSVETSLRELKTHYIDLLLMHDCNYNHVTDSMVKFLESLKQNGKILAYGAATTPETARMIETRYPGKFIFQLPDSVIRRSRNPWTPVRSFLTYGLLHGADQVLRWAQEDRKKLTAAGLIPIERKEIFELMLQYGVSVNPSGAVVCSMLDPAHLEENLRILETPRFSSLQIKIFADWVSNRVNQF